MNTEATLFIVDDDESACRGISELATSINVNSETYHTAEAFVKAYRPSRPGCVIVDERLPRTTGLELQGWLRSSDSHLPVIFVSAHASVRMAVRAMKKGALTVLEKPYNDDELLDAIIDGLKINSRNRELNERSQLIKDRLNSLSSTERTVMTMIVNGETNRSIASQLDVSVRTVERHRHEVFRKTDTNSVAELVRLVLEMEMGKTVDSTEKTRQTADSLV